MNRNNPWDQPVYAQFREKIDPFRDHQYFRPLDRLYNGDNSFWSVPSHEPPLNKHFWELVSCHLNNDRIKKAAASLANAIAHWEPDGKKLVFAAILRAGVPVADWLCRLLPGSAAVSISLFVGLGIDKAALKLIRQQYPNRKIIFVDGWTGKGGVAREISQTKAGPLAVLIDPWGCADFSGAGDDLFCPSACFTGAATLGFSRTFYVNSESLFAAYLFPREYCQEELVKNWQMNSPKHLNSYEYAETKKKFFKQTDMRLHSNEVCRALINADPDTVYFFNDPVYVKEHYPLLLALAELRKVKVVYNAGMLSGYRTRAACSFKKV
ncbi:MAG: hypothetical protein GY795_44140 [Desulfobacterales bacterium]|nr:hypothetical protein [Desulfobacterales bacterium]